MSDPIDLCSPNGKLYVTVNPEAGGRLDRVRFEVGGTVYDIFEPDRALKWMCPWVGRLPGRMVRTLGDPKSVVSANERGIHGIVQYRPCRVVSKDACASALSQEFAQSADGFVYPGKFSVWIEYQVHDGKLICGCWVENVGRVAIPIMVGAHMFGLKRPFGEEQPVLDANPNRFFPFDPDTKVPLGTLRNVTAKERLCNRQLSEEFAVDHCYYGWSKPATATWPESGFRLTVADEFGDLSHLHLWTTDPNVWAFEPQTGVANALSHSMSRSRSAGYRVLRPGERLNYQVSFGFEEITA